MNYLGTSGLGLGYGYGDYDSILGNGSLANWPYSNLTNPYLGGLSGTTAKDALLNRDLLLNRYGSLDRLSNPTDYAKYNLLLQNLRDLDGRYLIDKYKNPEDWYHD